MTTPQSKKKLAKKLDKLTTDALKSILTKSGIKIGDYIIIPRDGKFTVSLQKRPIYETYSKSAAMILAKMISKKAKRADILSILNADNIAYSMRNNIRIYEYYLERAISDNDIIKRDLMDIRLDKDYKLYEEAKQLLQSSYTKIF